MKTKLLLMLMLGLAATARALPGVSAQPVYDVTRNSLSCSSVTFSGTATELTSNTTAPTSAPVYEIMAYSLHASATCYFSDSINISSANANIGFPIYPYPGNQVVPPAPVTFKISPLQPFYGISGNDNGSRNGCSAMVCKRR